MLTVIGGLTKREDAVYSINPKNGGHEAIEPMMEYLGLKHKFLPFDDELQAINISILQE